MATRASESSLHRSVQLPTPKITTAPKPSNTVTQTYALELWLAANKWMSGDNWLKDNSDKVLTSHHIFRGDYPRHNLLQGANGIDVD
jgi:hypothetical protein